MAKTYTAHYHRLPDILDSLIKSKSLRDGKNFTASKLASAINVDRSLIQRLLKGNILNPRIDTLIKISRFFIQDGFNLRIDDLLGLDTDTVDIQEQENIENTSVSLPLYKMNNFNGQRIGFISMDIYNPSPAMIAVISDIDIDPIFKAGSVFIIDMLKKPKPESLVAIRATSNNKLIICKHMETNNKILGTVVRVNAKT